MEKKYPSLSRIVCKETGETVLNNICNYLFMMSLVKDPEITTTIEVESLRELIQMINDHKDAIKIALDALGKVDAYWFDASTEEGACAICDSNMHENVMDKHGQINGDSCAFEVAHKAIQKIKELTEEKKDGN